MKIPRYFNSVNCVFQPNDGLTKSKKVEGLNIKHISKNAVFSVIFHEIKSFSPVRYTEKYISIVMSVFLGSEEIVISK